MRAGVEDCADGAEEAVKVQRWHLATGMILARLLEEWAVAVA